MTIKKSASAFLLVLGMVSAAVAVGVVTVNGQSWACQNSCVVTAENGRISITDSGGGWIFPLDEDTPVI